MKPVRGGTTRLIAAMLIIASVDANSQWRKVDVPGLVYCFAEVPNGSGGTNLLVGTSNKGALLSTDKGSSWASVNTGMLGLNVYPLLVVSRILQDTLVFAGTPHRGIFRSTDHGMSWAETGGGFSSRVVLALAELPGAPGRKDILAGTDSGHVFRSTDYGSSWMRADSGMVPWPHAVQVFKLLPGGSILAGTGNNSSYVGAIFHSTDGGGRWVKVHAGYAIYDIKVVVNQQGAVSVFAAGSQGLLRSDTTCTAWTEVRSGFTFANALAVSDTVVFAGTNQGVYRSKDFGGSWVAVNDSLPVPVQNIFNLATFGGYLFAGSYNGAVYRRPLSEITTDVGAGAADVPRIFALAQNYPNPFNPLTTIKYELPNSSRVKLSVYDMLGRLVSVLVDERKEMGVHEVKFDAGALSSGVYFYRLQAGDFVQTRKLQLIR